MLRIISRTLSPPSLLNNAVTHSGPFYPLRYNCSFPLSTVTANLLHNLVDLYTYINDEVLTYVITLPVVSGNTFGVFK